MKGIHVFYPNANRNNMVWDTQNHVHVKSPFVEKSNPFILHDFDVILLYLSILNWKKFNGHIELYTNQAGLEIFEHINVSFLYNKIDTTLIDEQSQKYRIDANIFWAGHKLLVLDKMEPPFVIFDLDFYAEIDLSKLRFYEFDMGLFHFEAPSLTYPFPYNMAGFDRVDWPVNWDWDSHAVNVAVLYFGNKQALRDYTSLALAYMDGNDAPSRYEIFNSRMTFAEQRILGELVAKSDYETTCLITGLYYPMFENDNSIGFVDVKTLRTGIFKETLEGIHKYSNVKRMEHYLNHLWGYKAILLMDKDIRAEFVLRLLEKVKRDFPQHFDELDKGLANWYAANKGINSKIG